MSPLGHVGHSSARHNHAVVTGAAKLAVAAVHVAQVCCGVCTAVRAQTQTLTATCSSNTHTQATQLTHTHNTQDRSRTRQSRI